jgi:aminoglycoside phosphotransferase
MTLTTSLPLLLSKHPHTPILTGWSGAECYYLHGLAAYLKISPSDGPSNLAHEKEVLEWLRGKLPVPKVLGFERADHKQFILLSGIEGPPGSEYIAGNLEKPALIEEFVSSSARAMRQIHDLPIDNCPFAQDIDIKLAAALDNIRRGFVDEGDFDNENMGRTALEIYHELVEKKPLVEDLVFTHGDFCLPNYMVLDGEVSGFIDFDRGGVADRYQDIALFLRSFAFNAEIPIDVNDIFCRAYGIDSLDEEKIYYYRLLDELF